MAKVFLGIAIFFIAVAGFFSFQTKNKVNDIRGQLQQAQNQVTTSNAAQKKAEEETKATAEQLAAANTAKQTAEAAIVAAKEEAAKIREEVTAAEAKASEKDKEIEDLKTKLAAVPETPKDSPEMVELQGKLQEALTKLEEQSQVAKSLEAKQKDAEARTAELLAEKARRDRGLSAPGLEGKILAVDPNWNFVVLSIGDRQGVARNSTVLVKRGRTLVGRLKVTSVDPSTSIADVVPGSIPRGDFIRPGDTVIFSGSTTHEQQGNVAPGGSQG